VCSTMLLIDGGGLSICSGVSPLPGLVGLGGVGCVSGGVVCVLGLVREEGGVWLAVWCRVGVVCLCRSAFCVGWDGLV
jgi:hypothetical protein